MNALAVASGGSIGTTSASTRSWGSHLSLGELLDINEIEPSPANHLGWLARRQKLYQPGWLSTDKDAGTGPNSALRYVVVVTSSTSGISAFDVSANSEPRESLAETMQKVAPRDALRPAPAASASDHSVIDPSRKPLDPNSEKTHRLVSSLKSYAGFTANWDGDGSSSPDEEAINAALTFLTFVPIGAGVPNVMLLASGEPAFYWEFDDVYAEIGFDHQGQFYAYAERPGWAPLHMDDIPIKQGFPEKVLEILRGEPVQFIVE